MRNTGKLFPLLLCLLLLLGCGRGPGENAASTEPDRQTMAPMESGDSANQPTERVDSGLDQEVRAAIDAHETKRFWRVEAPGSFPETVTLWSFTAADPESLWPTLREGPLAKAEGLREQPGARCRFTLEGKTVDAQIQDRELRFSFRSAKQAAAFAGELAAAEARRLGLSVEDRPEEHSSLISLTATPELDGLPLDAHYRSAAGIMGGVCGVIADGKAVRLAFPLGDLQPAGQVSATSLLRPEEVQATLLFLNAAGEGPGPKAVTVYQSCQPVCLLDAQSGTIRPAWRVSGMEYLFAPGAAANRTEILELLVDAATGEVFSARGSH